MRERRLISGIGQRASDLVHIVGIFAAHPGPCRAVDCGEIVRIQRPHLPIRPAEKKIDQTEQAQQHGCNQAKTRCATLCLLNCTLGVNRHPESIYRVAKASRCYVFIRAMK